MKGLRRRSGWLLLLASSGVLFSGCLARVQGNLDLLLGSGALENAMRLPYSSVLPVAQFLLRLR